MSLITSEHLAKFLGITDPSEVQDQLDLLVDLIDGAVKGYCRRDLELKVQEEFLNGTDGTILKVRHYPIVTFTKLYSVDYAGVTTEIAATEYQIDAEPGLIIARYTSWTKGIRNYKASYSAGYSATTIPQDLKMACLKWAAIEWNRMQRKAHGLSSTQIGDLTITFEIEKVPESVAALLSRFERPPYG